MPALVVVAAVVLYAIAISYFSLQRHDAYSSARFDLGNMDQAVWNTAFEGRILETTDEDGETVSRLQNHADPLLLLFAPLYRVWPSVAWLLVVQAAIVGLGAWPLFRLCEHFLKRIPGCDPRWPAALLAVGYLVNYGLQSANLFDFHPQTLAGTLLLLAFWSLVSGRLWPFVLFAALAAAAKEEVVLSVAMMGLYAVYPLRKPRLGVPIFVGGMAYFLVVMLVVIPSFNDGETSRLVSERYGAFGGSMTGLVKTAFIDPLAVLGYALAPGKLLYLLSVVGTAGLLGPLAPLVLAIASPEIAINLLSSRPQMTDLRYHYSAPIIPFAYAAAAAGLANLARFGLWLKGRFRGRETSRGLSEDLFASFLPLAFALWVLFFGVWLDYLRGPLPLSINRGEDNPVVMRQLPEASVRNLDGAVAIVPKDPGVKVSASNWIGSHLSQRRTLYLFPVIRDADYVVVDLARPSYYTSVDRDKASITLSALRDDPDYELVYSKENVAVFKKVGAP